MRSAKAKPPNAAADKKSPAGAGVRGVCELGPNAPSRARFLALRSVMPRFHDFTLSSQAAEQEFDVDARRPSHRASCARNG